MSPHQGCAGRPFFLRGGARVKIRGAGRGKGENPRGGAKERKSTNSNFFYKSAYNEKYNITYYDINHKIDHNIIILAENKYCIRNCDYDHPFLIIIPE